MKLMENNNNKSLNSKYLILIIILLIVVNIFLGTALFLARTKNATSNNTVTYNKISELINNKDDGVIYYYNSNSSKKINKEIKEYLDELKIHYYAYDDVDVSKEEYNKFLSLLSIDKDVFGVPAIIYIRDGVMYGNIINIDSKESVKQFIDDYDLYTVK